MDGIGHAGRCPGTLRAILESTHAEDLEDNGWTRELAGHPPGSVETWRRGDLRLSIADMSGNFGIGYVIGVFRTIAGVEIHHPNVRCDDPADLPGAVRAAFDVLASAAAAAAETGGRISGGAAEIVVVRHPSGAKVEIGIGGTEEQVIHYSRAGTRVTVSAAMYLMGGLDEVISAECALDPTTVGMLAQSMVRELIAG